jgi:hypothetical protein
VSDLWLDLAEALTVSEREHRDRGEQMWHTNDVLTAVRLKGIADGLDMAREHMLRLTAEARAGRNAARTPRADNAEPGCLNCSDGPHPDGAGGCTRYTTPRGQR